MSDGGISLPFAEEGRTRRQIARRRHAINLEGSKTNR